MHRGLQQIEGPFDVGELSRRRQPNDPISVVALGTFDGVHIGHQAILAEAVRIKDTIQKETSEKTVESVAFTFDQLPLEVLRPERAPGRILTTRARCARILDTGIDRVVVAQFNDTFARMEPSDYVKHILFGAFNLGAIVVGFNHTFGYKGRGDVDLLRKEAEARGAEVIVMGGVTADGGVVSSTRIRRLLLDGDCEQASSLLGGPFFLDGHVIHGHKQGRLLGYPTANLRLEPHLLIPADGVYLTRVESSGEQLGYGLTIVSDRPTFHGDTRSLETYILDYSGDLYGAPLRLHFLKYLRPITQFAGPDALKEQIASDVSKARQLIDEDTP